MTGEILPLIMRRLTAGSGGPPLFFDDPLDRRELVDGLAAILPGLAGATPGELAHRDSDQLPSITEVLSAVDYHLLSGNPPKPGYGLARLARLRTLLERALFELLMRGDTLSLAAADGITDEDRVLASQALEMSQVAPRETPYAADIEKLVDWLAARAEGGEPVTVISTNYDIEVEQQLYPRLGYDVWNRIDFGTAVRHPGDPRVYRRPTTAAHTKKSEPPIFGVYKLHGSLNWLRCDACDHIYVNPLGAISYLSFLLGPDYDRYVLRWPVLRDAKEEGAVECHCGHQPLRHLLVAPSYVRDVRDPILLGIWRSALDALREAGEWVIAGYSLTPEDVAIRSLLLRGYRRDKSPPPRVVAVQHMRKEPELSRYELLLPGSEYFEHGLMTFIGT